MFFQPISLDSSVGDRIGSDARDRKVDVPEVASFRDLTSNFRHFDFEHWTFTFILF